MTDGKDRSLLLMPKRHRGQLSSALAEFFDEKADAEDSGVESSLAESSEPSTVEPENETSLKEEAKVHLVKDKKQEQEVIATIETVSDGISGPALHTLALTDIAVSPYQTREDFDPNELEALAKSIEAKGVVQPILVRPSLDDESPFQLVAGERRLRAAKLAGLETIPALIHRFSDQESLEIAIVENAQRENLNAIEEAQAYKRLVDEFKLTQTAIAEVVGRNRTTITNALRLLQLEPEVLELIKSGELSPGHGRALLQIEDPALQVRLAGKTVSDGLSVRALEALVARFSNPEEEEELSEGEEKLLASIERLQSRVSGYLEMDEGVSLNLDAQGRKRLTLTFDTEASWRRFVSRIK